MPQKYTEYLKCDFTDTEIADAAKELARANARKSSIEQQKKDVDAQLKSEIVAQETIIGRLSAQINTGSEYRNVECRIELDTPEAGQKRVVRLDTGEEVSVKRMTDEDRQTVLDLQTKAEAAEAKEKADKEPIVTPPPVLNRIEAPAVESEVTMSSEVAQEMISKAMDYSSTLASAVSVGGTHQKGTRQRRGARNPEAEAYVDGSAEDFTPEESAE